MAGVNSVSLGSQLNIKLPADDGGLDKTQLSPLLCCSFKEQSCVFVDLMQIEDKFHCLESIIIGEVSVYEEGVNKRKSNFHFQKCLCPLTRKCPLTGKCKYRV